MELLDQAMRYCKTSRFNHDRRFYIYWKLYLKDLTNLTFAKSNLVKQFTTQNNKTNG